MPLEYIDDDEPVFVFELVFVFMLLPVLEPEPVPVVYTELLVVSVVGCTYMLVINVLPVLVTVLPDDMPVEDDPDDPDVLLDDPDDPDDALVEPDNPDASVDEPDEITVVEPVVELESLLVLELGRNAV